MAIESVRVSLRATSRERHAVGHDDFIQKLRLPPDDPYAKLSAEPGKRTSGLVVFFELNVADFQQHEDPWDELSIQLTSRCKEIASWLDARSQESMNACAADGLDITLFFNVWINSDQIDLQIPPELLNACGRLSIPIRLLSND